VRFLLLGFGRDDNLIDIIVVEDHVRVLEVNKGVGAVSIQAKIAVGVLAFIACENDLLLFV
jgi:hypothetical protein